MDEPVSVNQSGGSARMERKKLSLFTNEERFEFSSIAGPPYHIVRKVREMEMGLCRDNISNLFFFLPLASF